MKPLLLPKEMKKDQEYEPDMDKDQYQDVGNDKGGVRQDEDEDDQ
jgi:hypothetical protein